MTKPIYGVWTFSRFDGGVYTGDHADADFERAKPRNDFVASLKPKETKKTSFGNPYKTYQISKFNASVTKALQAIKAKKEGRFDASLFEAAINSTNISHITVIPMIREMLGIPDNEFFLENAFRSVPVPQLKARIPERDTFRPQLSLDRLEELDFANLKFGEANFDLKHNDAPIMVPTEDRMTANFDPYTMGLDEASRSLKEARNALALWELTKLSTNASTVADITAVSSGLSLNNPKKDLANIFNTFYQANRARINITCWNPVDYQLYEANTWVHGYAPGKDVTDYGMVQLAGFPDVLAIIDSMVPRGFVYAVNAFASLKGEGPLQTETWREQRRNADLGVVRDYVQFMIPNKARYGTKISLAGITPGTEPQTLADVRKLVAVPTVAVS
jgi:hypothetical protein